MRRTTTITVLVMSAWAAAAGAAGTPEPHGLGLLAGRAADDAALAKLKAALADGRPEVRAAAVRVINVSGLGVLVPAVRDALSAEQDPPAASEMIRFLASVNRPELDTAAIDAARRLGQGMHVVLADGLARRGPAAAVHVPVLRELGFSESAWRVFYALAAARAAAGPGPLAAPILRERDAAAWRTLLDALRIANAPLDGGLAVAAVGSPSADIRTATYWSLARAADPARPADEILRAALRESPEAKAEGTADLQAALAFEMLRRAQGETPRSLLPTLEAIGASLTTSLPREALEASGQIRLFDAAERRLISRGISGREDTLDRMLKHDSGTASVARPTRGRVSTAGGFPLGYVDDVIHATGCELKGFGRLLAGEVTYGVDGRPRHVGLVPGGASKECLEAARVLLVSALAPVGKPANADRKALLLVPDHPEFTACLDEAARFPPFLPQPVGRIPEGAPKSVIQEPRKTRDLKPRYPEAAKQMGTQGVVILEASVAPTGCIYEVSLLRGQETSLDLEALRAVAGWAYTPTLLDGKAVPITMTVTVNFKLSR